MRFAHAGRSRFGTVSEGRITVFEGDPFSNPNRTSEQVTLAAVTVLTPVPSCTMIGLWNNFHERARKEGLQRPPHPLYFIKAPGSFAADRAAIRRPRGYDGQIAFEGELGVVIGKRCADVGEGEAENHIFGYTCVNDVTARDILKSDPSFTQWTRAKSFDTFGPFGPVIARGLDPAKLRVRTKVNGAERQNYAVSDMFFSPRQIVSLVSRDITLCPGDVIACGTSVGAGPLAAGDVVEVVIDGIGTLANIMQ